MIDPQKALGVALSAPESSNHKQPAKNEVQIGHRSITDPYTKDNVVERWGIPESLVTAFEPRTPRLWMVEGFLKVGDLATFFADSATGKTVSLVDIGMANVLKKRWLPRLEEQPFDDMLEDRATFATLGTPFVLWNLEMDRDRMMERVQASAANWGLTGDSEELEELGFYVFNLPSPALEIAHPSHIDAMIEVLDKIKDKHNATSIMWGVDPLTSASYLLNQYLPEMRIGLDGLKKVTNETSSTGIISHHANKGDGNYRGTPVIMEASDVMMKLEVANEKQRDLIRFECLKSRDEWVPTFGAQLQFFSEDVEVEGFSVKQRVLTHIGMLRSAEDMVISGRRNKTDVAMDVAKVVLERAGEEGIRSQTTFAALIQAEVETKKYGEDYVSNGTVKKALALLEDRGEIRKSPNYVYSFPNGKNKE